MTQSDIEFWQELYLQPVPFHISLLINIHSEGISEEDLWKRYIFVKIEDNTQRMPMVQIEAEIERICKEYFPKKTKDSARYINQKTKIDFDDTSWADDLYIDDDGEIKSKGFPF